MVTITVGYIAGFIAAAIFVSECTMASHVKSFVRPLILHSSSNMGPVGHDLHLVRRSER
jgi:hypothetical protein